jgi:hypothetical protein
MTNPLDGNGVGALHMLEPIWVWLYDYGPVTYPEGWKHDASGVKAYPQAHTYAFRSESEARAHPAAMGWKKDHPYVLQKSYLNGNAPLASSHTAVEPVAAELAMLVNWLPKLIAALGSKPEHVDDVARLARVHALIPTLTAQAAALVAAERDRDELQAQVNGLSAKCASLAPHGECACSYDTPDDLCLHHSPKLTAAESEVATLKARVAELEAGLEDVFRLNRRMQRQRALDQRAHARHRRPSRPPSHTPGEEQWPVS